MPLTPGNFERAAQKPGGGGGGGGQRGPCPPPILGIMCIKYVEFTPFGPPNPVYVPTLCKGVGFMLLNKYDACRNMLTSSYMPRPPMCYLNTV